MALASAPGSLELTCSTARGVLEDAAVVGTAVPVPITERSAPLADSGVSSYGSTTRSEPLMIVRASSSERKSEINRTASCRPSRLTSRRHLSKYWADDWSAVARSKPRAPGRGGAAERA